MNEIKKIDNPNNNNSSDSENIALKYLSNFLREALAVLIWAYTIIKLLIFDIDIFLIERMFPNYKWLIDYKFFILIGVVGAIWLVTKNKYILLWSAYIIFYPVIIIFWKIPFFLFKRQSWNLIFAFIDSIISFFKSIRISFITTSFFLVATILVLKSPDQVLLLVSIIILGVILFVVYVQRLIFVFKQSGMYTIYSNIFYVFGGVVKESPVMPVSEAMMKSSIEGLNGKQIESWTYNVQMLVLFNRVCFFVAKKMKSYQDSGFNVLSSVIGILVLVLYTVFAFAVINYGLFKIDYHYFSLSSPPSFFNFFYYSFNALLFNQINEVVAVSPVAQVALMVEYFFALFLVAILVSLIFSIRNQKDSDELNLIMNHLKEEGVKTEGLIRDKFKFNNVEEAMEALKVIRSSFIDFIYTLTESIAE